MTPTELDRAELDCGDNSCAFAATKGGMRTNGGCRCFDKYGYGRSAVGAAYRMLPDIIALKAERARLLAVVEKARKYVATEENLTDEAVRGAYCELKWALDAASGVGG